jgi:hypothetical protein
MRRSESRTSDHIAYASIAASAAVAEERPRTSQAVAGWPDDTTRWEDLERLFGLVRQLNCHCTTVEPSMWSAGVRMSATSC